MPSESSTEEPDEALQHGSLAHSLFVVREQFDAEFYAREYRDLSGDAEWLLRHFCERGWREGRNPNASFDTVAYLGTHGDVANIGWNPFYHYVLAGKAEDRQIVPALVPSEAARSFFGRDPGDWVAILQPEVDGVFYATAAGLELAGGVDLVAHFAYRGWRQGLAPNPAFDLSALLASRPELRDARINPLLVVLVERLAEQPAQAAPGSAAPSRADEDDPGISTTRFARSALFGIADRLDALSSEYATQRADLAGQYTDVVERVVAEHLDRSYYTSAYADVRDHGIDPVEHFCRLGWQERRNPAVWFDTGYYLQANTDIEQSGVNPFWHYLVEGRAEGRKPHRPGGFRRDIIERAVDPDARTKDWSRPEPTGVLTRTRLERILRAAVDSARGLVLSFSHDCYVRVTGGIQLFIADEQARYARQGLAYVHLSPFVPLLRLADAVSGPCLLNLVIDGREVGITNAADLEAALLRSPRRPEERRLFLVHCLLGHHLPDLIALQTAMASAANVFWVHDYSSICIGYTLLRNDVAYCHAPPPDSITCRVCVYGARRPHHLAQIRSFFEAVPFHVVAPSQAALAVWREHSDLPYVSAVAHEHCGLVPSDEPIPLRSLDAPVRVAFIGYARAHKGWQLWTELVSRAKRLGAYEFVHLGSNEAGRSTTELRHYVVQTSAGQPDAMADAVRDLEVDLVLVLSTWPETFSYVTYEALAGGADVVCMNDSGNVADTVLQRGRGIVADNDKSLFAFFTSLRAVEYVRLCRQQGVAAGQLVREGTTATLQLSGA